MEIVIVVLDAIERLGRLVADLIWKQPDSAELRAEALARLAKLQAMLQEDPLAKQLRDQLDTAVPKP